MRKALLLLIMAALFLPAHAMAKGTKTVHVSGYMRKDGTYVKSHYRSPPGSGSSSSKSSGSSRSSSSGFSGFGFSAPRVAVRTAPITTPRTVAKYPSVPDPEGFVDERDAELEQLRKALADVEARKTAEETFGRLWTNTLHGGSFRAEFIDYHGGKAELRKLDGTETAVPSVELSMRDQDWIKGEMNRRQAEKPKPKR